MGMSDHGRIEMRRLSDGAVYRFRLEARADGSIAYRREDKDVRIVRDPQWGWIVWDGESGAMMGRPWDVAAEDQGDRPPACEWVSKKGANAFVYRLVHL